MFISQFKYFIKRSIAWTVILVIIIFRSVKSKIINILNKLNLEVESDRLKTFRIQWPLASSTPEDLAVAGFYYFDEIAVFVV